jgi:hypothetical protein
MTNPSDVVAEWRELTRTMSGRSFLQVGDDMAATIERLSAERLQLREALGALHHAVRDLGEHDAISKLTYFEESPTKNGECHWRWVQLANAQGKTVEALSNTAEDTRHD